MGHCTEYPAGLAEVVRKVYVCSMSRLYQVIFFFRSFVVIGIIAENWSKQSMLIPKNYHKTICCAILCCLPKNCIMLNSDFEIKVP